jgi:ribosomal protein S12 methylthiotransferase
MRGRLTSRPARAVLREAERLVAAGVRELLVISQDTSAYGTDWKDRDNKFPILDLARALGDLGVWVRMHYVYPYPHVRDLVPLMAEGKILPYLDIPFQHAHPDTLRRMARPAAASRTLDEIAAWRAICPDIVLRSTFIVGYPGETETGLGVFSTKTSPGRGQTPCRTMCRTASRPSVGHGSWKRRRRSRRQSWRRRWAR